MKIRINHIILFFVLSSFFLSSAFAQNTVKHFIEDLSIKVDRALQQKDIVEANRAFLQYFDFDLFADKCIVDQRRMFGNAEMVIYKELFRKNLEKRMSDKIFFDTHDKAFKMSIKNIQQDDIGVQKVNTLIKVTKGNIKLAIMLAQRAGTYAVTDYEVNGALLSRQYRSQFNRLLRTNSVQEFLKTLERKML